MKKTLTLATALAAACSYATTWTVTSTEDSATPTEGMFRYALENAVDGDTVTFSPSIAGGTISLYERPDRAGKDTSFVIDGKALTVEGPEGGITLNGGWPWKFGSNTDAGGRIFLVQNATGKTVFRNITFKGGHGRGWNAAGNKYFQGGAVGAYSDVRFENCDFIQNGAADETAFAPSIRGGGAIYAENSALEIVGCNFVSNVVINGSVSYGGAICHNGGTISVSGTRFDCNRSKSFCGAVYLNGLTSAEFTDCLCLNSDEPGGNGVHGGFLWTKMNSPATIRFTRCAFRNDNCLGTGAQGGAYFAEGSALNYFIDCEVSGCTASNGGGLRNHGVGYFVNCTFFRNVGNQWGAQIDGRADNYYVNCTFVGGVANETKEGNPCGGVLACYAVGNFLNCVGAYNYLGFDDLTPAKDIGRLSGGLNYYNTVYNGLGADGSSITYATSLEDVDTSAKLFADYEMVSTVNYLNEPAHELNRAIIMPKIEELKPSQADRPRVVPIARGGLLNGTGYPVKISADASYCAYTTDGGDTWTTFWGEDDGTAALIVADQAGNAYHRGRTPIGAATYVSPMNATIFQIL